MSHGLNLLGLQLTWEPDYTAGWFSDQFPKPRGFPNPPRQQLPPHIFITRTLYQIAIWPRDIILPVQEWWSRKRQTIGFALTDAPVGNLAEAPHISRCIIRCRGDHGRRAPGRSCKFAIPEQNVPIRLSIGVRARIRANSSDSHYDKQWLDHKVYYGSGFAGRWHTASGCRDSLQEYTDHHDIL